MVERKAGEIALMMGGDFTCSNRWWQQLRDET
jgi:hypothetical protein